MDMEAGKTLTNEEVIRELLDLLKKNAMKEQANDVFEICSYVDGLEKKIASISILFPPFCKWGSLGRPCTLITDYRKGVASLSFSLSGLP